MKSFPRLAYLISTKIKNPQKFIKPLHIPVEVERKKPEYEIKKEKLPPRSPRDKPSIFDVTDSTLKLTWGEAEFTSHAEVTPVYYIVERR